ncbi:hypothetical protein FE633_12545 [Streptomyces montanus]|uniref:Uncharacterized protein n=1 Tax=Streptomyces montanus TaxID=2580423 RepID=A0A5R9FRH8_9ACTN|nr:hypothetical protein FE633_12545 [Streptomyces montanus]
MEDPLLSAQPRPRLSGSTPKRRARPHPNWPAPAPGVKGWAQRKMPDLTRGRRTAAERRGSRPRGVLPICVERTAAALGFVEAIGALRGTCHFRQTKGPFRLTWRRRAARRPAVPAAASLRFRCCRAAAPSADRLSGPPSR